MELKPRIRFLLLFAGLAALVISFGHLTLDIGGTGSFKSNLTEAALVISLPFLPRWHHALLLSLFTAFNVAPDGSLLTESLNHVIAFPLLWLAGYRWGMVREVPFLVLRWIGLIAGYYLGTLMLSDALKLMLGRTDLRQILSTTHLMSRATVYEYLATTLLALFYILLIRELRIRKTAQADLEERNTELSRHKQLLETQYDSTKEGILLISPDGRMISWNRRFVEIWQVPQDILESGSEGRAFQYAKSVMENPDELLPMTAILRADPAATHEDLLHLKNGRTLMRFTTAIRYGNVVKERMWFFRDITDLEKALAERESLQIKLSQSQKMEAIGQLAGGVAHDFNNSLGVILGAAELAGIGDLPTESRSYLDMIVTAARRASSLTRKLLSFSRQGTRHMDMIDTNAVARDAVALLQSSIDKRIDIVLENKASRTYVMGDTGLLQNALMNLGINASHAMPEAGTITVTLDNLALDKDYCETSPFQLVPGNYLEIAVKDTGCGIAPENLGRIFEPFFTTKVEGKGTGLGLASVYGVMQDHDGAITVYSELGAGTVFKLYFPLPADTLDLYEDAPPQPESLPSGTGTILLADDEELIRKTTSTVLERLGYTVLTARDGLEALELFKAHRDEIGIVLMDMIMPKLGGRQTFEGIRQFDAEVPIVICSGFSKAEDLEALKEKEISGFLQKPFRHAQLAQTVAASIRKPVQQA